MQYKFFVIPVMDTQQAEQDLNRFLRSCRPMSVHLVITHIFW
jgi:hypothetical protein